MYPLVLIAFLSYCRWVEQPDWWRFIQLGLVCLLRHIDTLLPAALVAALALFFRQPLSVRTGIGVIVLILACFAVLVALLPTPDWRDFSPVHVQGAAEVMQWLFGADSRQILLGRIGLLLLGTALVVIVVSHKQWRWMGLLPLFMALSMAQVTGRPVTDAPLAQRLPALVFETLNTDNNCLIIWDRSIEGWPANHQRFRLQYHFPHCELQLVSPLLCADVAGWVITQQPTAECPAVELVIPLPPDLLLYRPESFHR